MHRIRRILDGTAIDAATLKWQTFNENFGSLPASVRWELSLSFVCCLCPAPVAGVGCANDPHLLRQVVRWFNIKKCEYVHEWFCCYESANVDIKVVKLDCVHGTQISLFGSRDKSLRPFAIRHNCIKGSIQLHSQSSVIVQWIGVFSFF